MRAKRIGFKLVVFITGDLAENLGVKCYQSLKFSLFAGCVKQLVLIIFQFYIFKNT